jgi:hypothetical protein
MATAVSATRNKILKINGRNDAVSSQDRVRSPDGPQLSQLAFKCLDDTQPPSSSEDDRSDMSADESDNHSQRPTGFMTAPPLKERSVDEFEVDGRRLPEHSKSQASSSSWTDLDLSIVVAVITPLVNWLTGSDHLKNLFLVLFLIVYLHQLIQGM